jgi:hypothetical protein
MRSWWSDDVHESVAGAAAYAPGSPGRRTSDDETRARSTERGTTRELVNRGARESIRVVDDSFNDACPDKAFALRSADTSCVEGGRRHRGAVATHPLDNLMVEAWHDDSRSVAVWLDPAGSIRVAVDDR